MNRRSLIVGAVSALAVPAVLSAESASFNDYANSVGARQVARPGQTWQSIFGSRSDLARQFNRQNVQLAAGQTYLVPPPGSTMGSISPFPDRAQLGAGYQVVVSPRAYAWGLYRNGGLVRWGAAVCGSDWCTDVGRPCRTPSGTFTITEKAGPNRRSSSYPIIEAAEGKGALMPYFMRLTASGVGLHARYIRGTHETHGCIGMFYDDAKWLNLNVARKNHVRVRVEAYS